MKYEQLINRIIAADDLHYDAAQGRYASLSAEESHAIMSMCLENGITDHDQINTIVQWAGSVRIGEILYRSFMSGRIRIAGLSGDEPLFAPLTNAPQ